MIAFWILLTICLLFCLALLVWGLVESASPKLERFQIKGNIPTAFQGYKILHLSDLHNATFGRGQEKLVRLLKQTKPDLVVITGDLVNRRKRGLKGVEEALKLASELAPVYVVTGNHEAKSRDWVDLQLLVKRYGVLLRDGMVEIQRKGETFCLLGLDDPAFVRPKGERKNRKRDGERTWARLQPLLQTGKYQVLLSHRPDLIEVYAKAGIDLALCGHAHGGQVRIFGRGILSPEQGFFPKYTSGTYRVKNTDMVVSRGLGNSLCPVRIKNRPVVYEITLSIP